MMIIKKIKLVFFLVIFCYVAGYSQQKLTNAPMHKNQPKDPVAVIFQDIESCLARADVGGISKYLSQQTYFSLSNGVSGYYSANQAYYVLENFFNLYQVISFRFDNVKADDNNPYATGVYNFIFKGDRNTAQVYISLKNTGGAWKITQITIN